MWSFSPVEYDPARARATINDLSAELAKAKDRCAKEMEARHRAEARVTELQQRGTELLEEARAARREAKGLRRLLDAAIAVYGTGDMDEAAAIVAEGEGRS